MPLSYLGETALWASVRKVMSRELNSVGSKDWKKMPRLSCPASLTEEPSSLVSNVIDKLCSSLRQSSFCLCHQYFLKLSLHLLPRSSHPVTEGNFSRTSQVILWHPIPQGRVAQRVKISCCGFILPILLFLDIPATRTVPQRVCFPDPLVARWRRVPCILISKVLCPEAHHSPVLFCWR